MAAAAPPSDVVRVTDLHKRFAGQEVLRGIDLVVRAGETVAIMGPSGSGKSVLLKHLIGLLRPDAGTVEVWGERVDRLDEDALNRLRLRMGMVFQSAALFDSLTVGENVAFPVVRHRRVDRPAVEQIVAEKLALVGMEGTEALMPAELSGGMRKRVGIARALALEPALMLYDEPTAGLDPVTARTLDQVVRDLRQRLGVTSVAVTHDLVTAFGVADRVAVIDQGEFAEVGAPDDLARSRDPRVVRFLRSAAPPAPLKAAV